MVCVRLQDRWIDRQPFGLKELAPQLDNPLGEGQQTKLMAASEHRPFRVRVSIDVFGYDGELGIHTRTSDAVVLEAIGNVTADPDFDMRGRASSTAALAAPVLATRSRRWWADSKKASKKSS